MNNKTYIAPNATVVGDIELAEDVNIWYGAVLRGDCGKITVGKGTNIQDNCVVHDETTIGEYCTIGHGAIVHGCTIGNDCLIGMGAVILSGAELGDGCLVGAGAVVPGKVKAPAGSFLLGTPARIVGECTPEQIEEFRKDALDYVDRAKKVF